MLRNERLTHTPNGLADILWDEAELKFNIESAARRIFKQNGYRIVQPPTFEYFDVYNAATPNKAESMFKFFDTDGRTLALRPDFTTSIARLAATKPMCESLPLRLCYCGSTFRNDEAFSQTRQREFSQVGIELIGENSAEADAEVIITTIEVIAEAGLKQFQLDIGQVAYFMEIAKDSGLNEHQADNLRKMINDKVQLVGDVLLSGMSASNKSVCGTVCVAKNTAEALKNFKDGDILVIPETNNDLVGILRKASAIITEKSGLTSHAAVVGMTLDIPVICGAEGATEILKNGTTITIDGSRGQVYGGVAKIV